MQAGKMTEKDKKVDASKEDIFTILNEAIEFRNAKRYRESDMKCAEALALSRNSSLAHLQMCLSLRMQGRQQAALHHAEQAWNYDRHINFALNYAQQLSSVGRTSEALSVLLAITPNTMSDLDRLRSEVQFARFVSQFPISASLDALVKIERSGKMLNYERVSDYLLSVISGKGSSSLIRMGDGEGAWTFLSGQDEADFGHLYRRARVSFLQDWFGSDKLIEDNGFFQFAMRMRNCIEMTSIVGITDVERVQHEYTLVSQRGIPTSVNVLRAVNVLPTFPDSNKLFCSNSIHHTMYHQSFFDKVISRNPRIGLISSFKQLGKIFCDRGAEVVFEKYTPGDSRNFWKDTLGNPICQYPDIFLEIKNDIERTDFTGVTVFVGAGFIGKQYVSMIHRNGGVAIDVGSVMDRLAAK